MPATKTQLDAAHAQEAEAELDDRYIEVPLAGHDGVVKDVRTMPANKWRASALRCLQRGDIDGFMASVLHEDDYDTYEELDPDQDGFGKVRRGRSPALRRPTGKVQWAFQVWEQYAEELEDDLLPRVDVLDLHRGQLSWRRLRVLIEGLPPESRTLTAMRNALTDEEFAQHAEKGEPEKGRWSQQEQLLAAVYDRLGTVQHVLISANTDSKSKRPKPPEPMRRPGSRAVKPKQEISEQQADTLFRLLNPEAA
jgi:hypothetical protein